MNKCYEFRSHNTPQTKEARRADTKIVPRAAGCWFNITQLVSELAYAMSVSVQSYVIQVRIVSGVLSRDSDSMQWSITDHTTQNTTLMQLPS